MLRSAYPTVTNAFAALRLLPPTPQAGALLACDFIETITLTSQNQYTLAVIEHTNRRIRILGAAAHPTTRCAGQTTRNVAMELEGAGATVNYITATRTRSPCSLRPDPGRDRHASRALRHPYTADELHHGTGGRLPTEALGRVRPCRDELLDRTLIRNARHLRHAPREFEQHHNAHQPHQAINQAAPLRAIPEPITIPDRSPAWTYPDTTGSAE
ncbi:integrase [Kitasatospora sp. NPDC048545]|uniref:integrase n=1 Tax=Kitasatospora sp. NPDC048545 TaxID=3157208 RepID=UPI0033F1AAC4